MTEQEKDLQRLSLDEWTGLVAKHLHSIETGAEIVESHVKQLYGIPDWETKAFAAIENAEKLLGTAYAQLAKSRQDMERKTRVK